MTIKIGSRIKLRQNSYPYNVVKGFNNDPEAVFVVSVRVGKYWYVVNETTEWQLPISVLPEECTTADKRKLHMRYLKGL